MKTLIIVCLILESAADYYNTLGVKRDATTKEIRSAFKKMALSHHPDKNKDDPDAESKFMTINEAYEVLKDEAARRKYDLYGEEGLKEDAERKQRSARHSYQYYREDFDIYGDDAEVITLSSGDFQTSVENRGESIWFINYYSPRCSHCHELAPAWRKIAKELEGVVRIGAVNCQDSREICQHLRGYPSLYLYTAAGSKQYNGARDLDSMITFVMNAVPLSPVIVMFDATFKRAVTEIYYPWLVSFYYSGDDCVSRPTLDRVAVSLKNMVYVGTVNCDENQKLCEKLPGEPGLLMFQGVEPSMSVAAILRQAVRIDTLVTQDIVFAVLKNLPQPEFLTDKEFDDIHDLVVEGSAPAQVVVMSRSSVPLECIKLKGLLKEQKVYQLDCNVHPHTCSDLHVTRYPTVLVIKNGGYERYHGRQDAADIASFITASLASPLIELTPAHFPLITTVPSVVDFFAPWCPPCMQLLPELRKAAGELPALHFGSVDCSVHSQLCTQLAIRSYPTMTMYNSSQPHQTTGYKTKDEIISYIQDVLHPPVIDLDYASWILKINNKKPEEVWFVDYYAPWCGPCRQLAPNWNKLAKSINSWQNTFVAKVDCTTNKACSEEGIQGYPTIRAYLSGSKGRALYRQYDGWGQFGDLKGWALPLLPSDVEALLPRDYIEKVLKSRTPWLVEFYTPMCGPCQRFAAVMEELAGKLKQRLKVGKVDCNQHYNLCYQAKLRGFPTLFFYPGATGGVQDIAGVEIATSSASEIYSHLTRHYPFLNIRRDEL